MCTVCGLRHRQPQLQLVLVRSTYRHVNGTNNEHVDVGKPSLRLVNQYLVSAVPSHLRSSLPRCLFADVRFAGDVITFAGHSCTACIDRQIKDNAEHHAHLHNPAPECRHMVRRPPRQAPARLLARAGYPKEVATAPPRFVEVQLSKRIW